MFNKVGLSKWRRLTVFVLVLGLCVTMIPIVALGDDGSDQIANTTSGTAITPEAIMESGEEKPEIELSPAKQEGTKVEAANNKTEIPKSKSEALSEKTDTIKPQAGPNNISQYVEIINTTIVYNNVEYKKGDKLPATLTVGAVITFKFDWQIVHENMQYISEGDYFIIQLPETAINFTKMPKQELKAAGNKVLGELSLEKSGKEAFIKCVLNKDAANAQDLHGGWLKAEGTVKEWKDGDPVASVAGIIIPKGVKIPTEPKDPSDVLPYGWWDDKPKFSKSGDFNKFSGKASWWIDANHDLFNDVFTGAKPNASRKNVVVADKFIDGVTYAGNLKFTLTFPYANPKTKNLSGRDIKNSETTITLSEVAPNNPYMEYDEFVKQMGNSAPMTYGIWQNKAIVINFGDLPGQMEIPHTFGELCDLIDKDSYVRELTVYQRDANGKVKRDPNGNPLKDPVLTTTTEVLDTTVKAITKESYARVYAGTDDWQRVDPDKVGNVLGIRISFSTIVDGADRPISNQAILYHDNTSVSSIKKGIQYVSFAGGVELGGPGDVDIIKLDGESNVSLAGVQFKIQKKNIKTGQYEDLPASKNGGVKETSSRGALEYDNLDWGEYKLIEVKPLDGYGPNITFTGDSNNGEFVINNKTTDTLHLTAYNYKVPEEDDNVLGEEEFPDDPIIPTDEPSVMGEEARTGDATGIITLILLMLASLVGGFVVYTKFISRRQ